MRNSGTQTLPFLFFVLSLILFNSTAMAQHSKPYFQQQLVYHIEVRLDDSLHMLEGKETLHYTNHSPDTLYFIYMHLWPNAYKNNQTALARQMARNNSTKLQFAGEERRGWIDSIHFTDAEGKLQWEYDEEHIDICKVYLRSPLLTGETTTIHTPFLVKLPGDFSRLGHIGTSYQISQWYPKPAVYDQDGWHPMPYLDQGEFYSEYGSFEVKITLPAIYRVAATGVLQEKEERDWLTALSNEDIPAESDDHRIGRQKTITFKQDRIHDFAFFCAQNYVVRKDTARLPSGKTVEAWAFFEPDSSSAWLRSAFYVKRAVEAYSEWVGEYPYEAATAVQGALSAGGGMEYPMVTVISAGSSPMQLDNVITHEVGHNWFYGILGSNEREYAWMDEGFNSYIEERYMERYYPDRSFGKEIGLSDKIYADYDHHWFSYLTANIHASYGYQRAINTPSIELPTVQYALLSYKRTAFLLSYLAAYLGQETFDDCMNSYYEAWKFKHPQPADIQEIFERISGKKLDWFFDDLFNTEKQFDYSLKRLKTEEHAFIVSIKNKGEIAAPFPLHLMKGDSLVKTIWFEGHPGLKKMSIPKLDCDHLRIDLEYQSPDLSLTNNHIRTSGLFKKRQPYQISAVPGFTQNDAKTIRVHPSLGYNTTDGLMLGLMVHNYDIQGKKFGYFLMPMYGFSSETLVGNAVLKYDWFIRDQDLKKVRLMGQYKRFAGYDKLEPSLNFFFKTGKIQHVKHWLSMSHAWIFEGEQEARFLHFYETARLRYHRTKKNALLNEKLSVAMMISANVRVEGTYQRTDRLSKKSKLKTRFYGGWTVISGGDYFDLYSAGSPDVNKDYYLIDRAGNEMAGWLGTNQALMDQGGFMSANLRADVFLLSANVEYRYGRFFHPYLHGLMVDEELYYETGLSLDLVFLEVYFPISSNVYAGRFPENGREWGESIRFTLNYNFNSLWNQLEIAF